MNITINPIDAVAISPFLVGSGLTMEGQEGDEIMYDLLLNQDWSGSPVETYSHSSVTRRYTGNGSVPDQLYPDWESMCSTVYNNTGLNSAKPAVVADLH